MQTIDTSQSFMKLLKASFLLAAAAIATRLDATDYLAVWNLTNGNIAKATIGVDRALFNTADQNVYNKERQAWLTRLDVVITDPSNAVLASYTKANVSIFTWNPAGNNLAVTQTNVSYFVFNFL